MPAVSIAWMASCHWLKATSEEDGNLTRFAPEKYHRQGTVMLEENMSHYLIYHLTSMGIIHFKKTKRTPQRQQTSIQEDTS